MYIFIRRLGIYFNLFFLVFNNYLFFGVLYFIIIVGIMFYNYYNFVKS